MICERGAPECKLRVGELEAPLAFRRMGSCPATPLNSLQYRRHCAAHALKSWQAFSTKSSQVTAEASAAPAVAAAELPLALQRSDSMDHSAALSLDNIRQSLIRQEDTIIFALIERAQFAANSPVYQSGAMPVPGYGADGRQFSLLEYMLWETEQTHCKVRRYTSPDEHPFFPNDLPPLILPPIQYEQVLAPAAREININEKIMALYLDHLVPGITQPGDDNNYGSAAVYDVLALQALSKRIHYGKFVAEAKFRAQAHEYAELIRRRDVNALMALLTDEDVEAKVVERVRRKAAIYGQDIGSADSQPGPSSAALAADGASAADPSTGGAGDGSEGQARGVSYKVEPEKVAELYRRWVMPLTKEVQIMYLLQRLE